MQTSIPVSRTIYNLCRNGKSVSGELAKDPTLSPTKVASSLFDKETIDLHETSEPELEAFECGHWGKSRPSDLFLQIFSDALSTIEKKPLKGAISPSLMGSNGVIPLTIIAPLYEICKHMANCILRAEKEILLFTSYWVASPAGDLLANALKKLSKKAGKRGTKVVIKMLYDHGTAKQVFNHHRLIPVEEYTEDIHIPPPEEVPNLEIEVTSFHIPVLGTYHGKFMIIDRKIAMVQSNNICENANLEMCVELEGDIVDSLYDNAMISWSKPFTPILPCHDQPAASQKSKRQFDSESLTKHFEEKGVFLVPKKLKDLPEHSNKDPHYDEDIAHETLRILSFLKPRENENHVHATTRFLNTTHIKEVTGTAPEISEDDSMLPYVLHPPHEPFPIALLCRKPRGPPTMSQKFRPNPQNAAFLSAVNHAKKSVFVCTPNLNAQPILDPLLKAARRGVRVTMYLSHGYNDSFELMPIQNGTNEVVVNKIYKDLEQEFHKNLNIYFHVGKDQIMPIHQQFDRRNCHIKLMIIDGHIGIQGSGNQDTYSYVHSSEVNIMIDSRLICKTWRKAINRNQNTRHYGAVQKEGEYAGCWVDPKTGEIAEGSLGLDYKKRDVGSAFIEIIKEIKQVHA